MKDIAKMREEMERKIREAEMSNEIEEKVGIACTVMGESCTQKGSAIEFAKKCIREQIAEVEFKWNVMVVKEVWR